MQGMYSTNVGMECRIALAMHFGRWQELLGKRPNLSTSNAENWYGKNDGYKRGNTPKLGAVICWRKGQAGNSNDGAGHVAIVEEIYPDGTILISESHWKGVNFQTKKLDKKFTYGSLIFQGFIYTPEEFVAESKSYRFAVGQTYTTQVNLKVRTGAGTDKRQKDRNELTADGKKHAISGEKACLKSGTRVTCLEIKEVGKDVWIRIPSGWIAGYYDNKVYVK